MQISENLASNHQLEPKAKAKFQTIYLQKAEISKISKEPEKKLLRHYLSTIEQITQNGFFLNRPFRIAPEQYPNISKNSLAKIHQAYQKTNTLKIERGEQNQILYSLPEHYPTSMKGWLNAKGGYLKIDRTQLNFLLDQLSDNELRIYFTLRRIFEANGAPAAGIETWYKVLRNSHLNISQNTLKSCLSSLSDKRIISLAEPISAKSRALSKFVVVVNNFNADLVSQVLSPSFPVFEGVGPSFPNFCVHIKEIDFKEGIILNQGKVDENYPVDTISQISEESDFKIINIPEFFPETISVHPEIACVSEVASVENSISHEEINHLPEILNKIPAVAEKMPLNINAKRNQQKFNFFGLDKLERPLEFTTVKQIQKTSGLSMDQVQESVMRFSRYYFSDQKIKAQFTNPIGMLRHHLITFKQVFVEPEWWLQNQHKEHLGAARFSPPKTAKTMAKDHNKIQAQSCRPVDMQYARPNYPSTVTPKKASIQHVSECFKNLINLL